MVNASICSGADKLSSVRFHVTSVTLAADMMLAYPFGAKGRNFEYAHFKPQDL